MWERAEGIAPDSCRNPGLREPVAARASTGSRPGMTTRAGDGGRRPALHAARRRLRLLRAHRRRPAGADAGDLRRRGPGHRAAAPRAEPAAVASGSCNVKFVQVPSLLSAARGTRDGTPLTAPSDRTVVRNHLHPPGRTCMKPILASALAVGCVSAALVGDDRLLPGSTDHQPGPPAPQTISRRPAPTPRTTPASAPARASSSGTRCWTPNGASHVRFDRTYRGLRRRRRPRRPPGRGTALPLVSGRSLAPFQLPTTRLGHRAGRHREGRLGRGPRPASTPRTTWSSWPCTAPPRSRGASTSPAARRRLARRRVRLRRRPQRPRPRPWASTRGGHRLRHRRGRRHRLARDHAVQRLAVHAGRPGTRGGNATYNGPQATARRRSSPTPTTSGATAPPATRAVGRRRRPLRHRQDLGLLQEHLRPQRHRQRRQGRPRVRPRRRLRQRLLERRLLLHALRRRRRHDATRWSRSTSPATR